MSLPWCPRHHRPIVASAYLQFDQSMYCHQYIASDPFRRAINLTAEEENVMTQSTTTSPQTKVLYTAKDYITGGRDGGSARSSDGRLDIQFTQPGTPGTGTNPEQLLGAGWSACFLGAMGLAAHKMKVSVPKDTSIDAEVDLCLTGDAYSLQARLNVRMPGLSQEVAQSIVDAAHQTCPYSKATRGNIPVKISVAV